MPRIIIPPQFKRVLARKPREMQVAVLECLSRLEADPRHPSLRTHKVKGVPGPVFEAYVDKGNRVTFERQGSTIVMRNNCNHDMLNRAP